MVDERRARRGRGCAGCLMGLVAVAIIGALAVALLWLVALRPYLHDRVRDELRAGVRAHVQAISTLPVLPSGKVVVTADEINRSLREQAGRYAPVTDPTVSISPDGFRVDFSLKGFGLTGMPSHYVGKPAVRDGDLIVVDGHISGPAAQVLTADDVAAIAHEQLAALLARSGVRATAVAMGDGSLTITTAPRGRAVVPAG